MRLAFMGTPAFSVPALDALVAAGHEIVAVYAQPPRPAGRGKKPKPSPVAARAESLSIPVRIPRSLRDPAIQQDFAALELDAAVVVAYGLLLPQPILDAPRFGCLNIHASLLPRWRGAAPIHRAVMAGDTETGVCIMAMDAGLDTGPVLRRATLPIGERETTGELHDRLAVLGAGAIVETLASLPQDATLQSENGATYAAKIQKSEAKIDWTRPAEEVARHIRGLSPFPGAWFLLDGQRVKALGAHAVPGRGSPGEVLEGLTIACGGGAVTLTRAQRAGKTAQDAATFLRGISLNSGTVIA